MTHRGLPWLLFALVWLTLPWLFPSSLSLNLLSQIGIAIIVCLSYNILLGQGGMLSFGHAVYAGMGAFLAMHTLNLVSAGSLSLPVSLVPIVGGLMALVLALMLGWITTQKAATPFAMITLGVGELVWAMSLMFPGFFGGEGGISGNRVTGSRPLGISFGPQIELYGLIAIYAFVCTWLMHAFTQTPLGRMLNAVRDNPERVAFIGHDPRQVRYIAFCISAFFAGIGGGLAALHFEIVTSEVVSSHRSGAYLLFVFLGGMGYFIGPILGAVLMVVTGVLMSEWTQAWLLYLGLLFVWMVMFVPGGLAGLVDQHLQLWRAGLLQRLWSRYVWALVMTIPAVTGVAVLIEMIYHLQLNATLTPELKMGPMRWNTDHRQTWLLVMIWSLVGVIAAVRAWRPLRRDWAVIVAEWQASQTTSSTSQSATYSPPDPRSDVERTFADSVPALTLSQVHKQFGPTVIIQGVDLCIRRGERVALIGPNGAGKSTLFNLISGRLPLSSGQICLNSRNISGHSPQQIHRMGLARSFQITHVFARMSVFENLRCAVLSASGHGLCFWRNLDRLQEVRTRAEHLLREVRLEHRRDDWAMNLTYAEQRALELAVTLAGGSEMILLDEPTAGMSRAETAYMMDLIRRLTHGKTLLMVEHDMDVVFGLADRVAVLVYGQVVAFDTPKNVRNNPLVQQAYLGDTDTRGSAC